MAQGNRQVQDLRSILDHLQAQLNDFEARLQENDRTLNRRTQTAGAPRSGQSSLCHSTMSTRPTTSSGSRSISSGSGGGHSDSTNVGIRPHSSSHTCNQSSSSSAAGPSGSGSAARGLVSHSSSAMSIDVNSLFHWNPSSSVGTKRKRSDIRSSSSHKKKPHTWSHTFVCLADPNQDMVPDGKERGNLIIAGLGEKRITFDAYADGRDIHEELLIQFPKLSAAGGYEFTRVAEGGKRLFVIPSPESGYSVNYLRSVLHQAKVFVRPLQRKLSLEPQMDIVADLTNDCPEEECLMCGKTVPMTTLREHLESCREHLESCRTSNERHTDSGTDTPHHDSMAEFPSNHTDTAEPSRHTDTAEPSRHTDNGTHHDSTAEFPSRHADSGTDAHQHDSMAELAASDNVSLEEDCLLYLETTTPPGSHDNDSSPIVFAEQSSEPKNIEELVNLLQGSMNTYDEFEMIVRRSQILTDALCRMDGSRFDPYKILKVVFIGEAGIDGGGLTREFFRIICVSIKSKYFGETGCIIHNAVAYQEGVFKKLGILAAMSLLHGGASFQIFSPSIFNFMCGVNPSNLDVKIDEVPQPKIRDILEEVQSISDVEILREKLFEHIDLLMECGYSKPVPHIMIENIPDIVHTVALHLVVLSSLAELTQLRDGLTCVEDVMGAFKKYPSFIQSFYCIGSLKKVTAGAIIGLFQNVKYSDTGSTQREKEMEIYMYFIKYLEECEIGFSFAIEDDRETTGKGSLKLISLNTVLEFCTGAECIPPIGYTVGTINFDHSSMFPTASTCALILALPAKCDNYGQFKENMNIGLCCGDFFGQY